jgi:F0F1-type ATP synthase gamma subunit
MMLILMRVKERIIGNLNEMLVCVSLQASAVAEEILKTEYDAARIIFNRFHSAISFKPTIATVLSPDVSPPSPA